jgi:hypothetical protein
MEGGEESEELGAVLFGDDGLAGQQSVADDVERGAGLDLGGARAGGALGVLAVGLGLFIAGHKVPSRFKRNTRRLGQGFWK